MSDDWDFYFARVNDAVSSIFVDLGIRPEAPLPPDDPVHLPALLVEHLGVGSTSEARRLISQGAVKIDGGVVTEIDVPRARLEGALVQAGKRRFMRFPAA